MSAIPNLETLIETAESSLRGLRTLSGELASARSDPQRVLGLIGRATQTANAAAFDVLRAQLAHDGAASRLDLLKGRFAEATNQLAHVARSVSAAEAPRATP